MNEWEGIVRLAIAALIGGLIGFERETLDKAAGLRTHMLVSLGAALFMVVSILIVQDFDTGMGNPRLDPTRIGSTIVTGVGFLGGGIIFRSQSGIISGLTTAAGLWVAAAIGMSAGAGYYVTAAGGGVLTLLILVVLRRAEKQIAVALKDGQRSEPD